MKNKKYTTVEKKNVFVWGGGDSLTSPKHTFYFIVFRLVRF